MKLYTKVTTDKLCSIECDICGKVYEDQLDIQEFLNYEAVGGYGSVFGDGCDIKLDICQECLKKRLGKYIRVTLNKPLYKRITNKVLNVRREYVAYKVVELLDEAEHDYRRGGSEDADGGLEPGPVDFEGIKKQILELLE